MALQRTVRVRDLSQVPLLQWESAGISRWNAMKTYIFLFQPVSLFGKVLCVIVVFHLVAYGPDIFVI